MAQQREEQWNLSPSKSIVERLPVVRPPKPDIFVHTHPKSHTNTIIAESVEKVFELSAWRVFLDAFHASCGFVHW
jgi:hypothetical protein